MVVIVLGVLASVAVPKFSRVLETRKTTEAEDVLSSLRTEQEHRCVQGKNYKMDLASLETSASASNSKNYTYSLTATGAKATSAKGYTIAMPAYQNGQLCCEGEYCSSLNKSYPSCSSLSVPDDECAATCAENPAQEKCCTSSQKWDGTQCIAKGLCEDEDDPERCCYDLDGAHWDLSTDSCVQGECEQLPDEDDMNTQKHCPTGYTGTLTREWDSFYCRWSDWEGECKEFEGKWTHVGSFSNSDQPSTNAALEAMQAKYGADISSCAFTGGNESSCSGSSQGKVCYIHETRDDYDISSNNECETLGFCYTVDDYYVYRCN